MCDKYKYRLLVVKNCLILEKGFEVLISFFGKQLKSWFLFLRKEFSTFFRYCYETEIKGYPLQPDYRFHYNNLFIHKSLGLPFWSC